MNGGFCALSAEYSTVGVEWPLLLLRYAMFAQSVVEYGALASTKTNLQMAFHSVADWVSHLGTGTWVAIGGVVVLLVWLRRR